MSHCLSAARGCICYPWGEIKQCGCSCSVCLHTEERSMKTVDDHHDTSEIFYLIVYPGGDRSILAVAEAQEFDVNDYDLASKNCYPDEQSAWVHARILALKHGKLLEDTREKALLE